MYSCMKCVVVGDDTVGKVRHVFIVSLVLGTERESSIDLSFGIIFYKQVSQRLSCSDCKRPPGRELASLDSLLGLG